MSADTFDFWIGDWDVSWEADGEQRLGTNTVSRVGDTIRELFRSPVDEYIGASVSRWDADAGAWVQDYWDNQGYTAIFQGVHADGRMVLERTSMLGTGPPTRLVWSDIGPDSLTWNYQRQTEAGGWESTWRIDYRRHAGI